MFYGEIRFYNQIQHNLQVYQEKLLHLFSAQKYLWLHKKYFNAFRVIHIFCDLVNCWCKIRQTDCNKTAHIYLKKNYKNYKCTKVLDALFVFAINVAPLQNAWREMISTYIIPSKR